MDRGIDLVNAFAKSVGLSSRSPVDKRERDYQRRLYHCCGECGVKSKARLVKCHPTKECMVCEECAQRLYKRK